VRLLGKTVFYLMIKGVYIPSIILRVEAEGVVTLRVLTGTWEGKSIKTGVCQGYGVGQWQHPELFPHDDIGMPIPTDGPDAEEKPAADDPQEPASMFEVSFVLYIEGGEADRDDVITTVTKNMEGAGIGRCLKALVSIDGIAVKAVK